MPTQLISIGPPTPITQNVVYALPAQLCAIASANALEVSVNGTTWTAYTAGTNTAASFVRCPSANTTITVKSATKGGSSGGKLPTAPLGQVLISQGDGVDPIFSTSPSVANMNVQFVMNGTEALVIANQYQIRSFTVSQIGAGGMIGQLTNFSDSTVNTPGATIVGGGSFNVLGRWNGSAWKVAAA